MVDSWSAVAACLRGPASSLVCGRAASFDSLMRRARPTTSWTPRSDVRRCLARTRHTNVPAHAPHASRPTARLLSLCIAASAVAQRRRAAHAVHSRASRAPLVTHAQASVPSRCRLAERVGPLLGTMREGACGAVGGSEAAAGEPGPARRWPLVTPRPAAPPGRVCRAAVDALVRSTAQRVPYRKIGCNGRY